MPKEGGNEVIGSPEKEMKTPNGVHRCMDAAFACYLLGSCATKGDKDRPRWALSSGESCEALGLGLGRPYRGKHPGTGMDGMDVWGNQRACAVISQAPKLSL